MPTFNRKKFWDGFREHIDATIEQEQVDGLEFILGQMEFDPFWNYIPQIAYALATIYHETAGSFQPVEEGYYLGSKTRVKAFQKKLRYYPWYGRGYVQLTWKANYEKAKSALNVDFIKNPAAVMEPINSYRILTLGMHQGWFTGKKLGDYIKPTKKDYANARRIINGTDKAGLIAGYARAFEKILNDSAATPADKLGTEQGATSANLPPDQAAVDNPTVPLVPAPVPVVEVPQVSASTDPPKEDTVTKIGNRFAALWTAAGTAIVAAGTFLTSTPVLIAATIIGGVALLGMGYMIINWRRAESKEKRDFDAKMEREKQAHELQLYTLRSAAEQHLQAVTIAPPPATEMANADSNGGNA